MSNRIQTNLLGRRVEFAGWIPNDAIRNKRGTIASAYVSEGIAVYDIELETGEVLSGRKIDGGALRLLPDDREVLDRAR